MHKRGLQVTQFASKLACCMAAVFLLLCALLFCACNNDLDKIPTTPEQNTTEEETFFIVFHPNDGGSDIYWQQGNDLPTMQREDFLFVGWFDEELSQQIDPQTLIDDGLSKDWHLYAKWQALLQFEGITFEDMQVDFDGEEHVLSVQNLPQGATVSYSPANSFSQVGCYLITATITQDGYCDLTLSATLTINKKLHNIEFIYPDDTIEVRVVEDGTALTDIPTLPKESGYNYAWQEFDFTNVTQSATLCCIKTPVQYTISYHNATDDLSPTLYTIESLDIALPTPQRDGYSFEGWFENEACQGEAVQILPSGSVGDRQFFAKWNIVSYTITYHTDGGIAPLDMPTVYTIQTPTFSLPALVQDGYIFVGWFLDAQLTQVINVFDVTLCKDVDLYAKWEKV